MYRTLNIVPVIMPIGTLSALTHALATIATVKQDANFDKKNKIRVSDSSYPRDPPKGPCGLNPVYTILCVKNLLFLSIINKSKKTKNFTTNPRSGYPPLRFFIVRHSFCKYLIINLVSAYISIYRKIIHFHTSMVS